MVVDKDTDLTVRAAAAKALAFKRTSESKLLDALLSDAVPADQRFHVIDLLRGSYNPAIRETVMQKFSFPSANLGETLPPIVDLVQRRGDARNGESMYTTKGNCAKCHRVAGVGKEVGPDLSEIGSKLSKDALYLSILDPSAGISHGYETFEVITNLGQIVSGILTSRTDDEVKLKNVDGIEFAFDVSQIEEVNKLHVSLMPADLQRNLSTSELVDLIEYLTTLKTPNGTSMPRVGTKRPSSSGKRGSTLVAP